RFGQPTPSGIEGDGFEQDLRLDTTQKGHEVIYSSAPVGLGSSSTIWRSLDGGRTFKYIPAQIPPYGKPIACVGGGDAELAVDSAGHLYFADLYLGNFAVGRSDDHGTTMPVTNCGGVGDAPVDRQWYTTIGDPTTAPATGGLFLVYDETPGSGFASQACPANIGNILSIARSPALGDPGATAGASFGKPLALSCDEGIMGNDVSFTYPGSGATSGPKVFVVHDNANLDDISVDRCAVTAESPTNPQGLTCTKDIVVSSFPGFKTGANFPTISVDDKGNLFTVWEEAPVTGSNVTGNTQLYFATSSDEGSSWTKARQLPTPGLDQDVMAWPGSGDPGRIDVAFYGTPAPWKPGDSRGPDSVVGRYSLYMVQTLDNGKTWTAPVLASEHFTHYGTMYTLIGGQTGNRGVGDFLQLRIGPSGEAEISYSDTNVFEGNLDLSPEAMYVRQIGGPSVYASNGTIKGTPPPAGGCVADPAKDATFDAGGVVGPDVPHLDILQACMSHADPSHYRITMKVADLTTPLGSTGPGPDPTAGGTVNIWQMQWHVPSTTDTTNGGALFMAYMESDNGGAPTCWVGHNSQQEAPGGAELTYPGSTQLPASDCTYTATKPGTITITVPVADVTEAGALDSTLYSVTASTQTVGPPNAETPPPTNVPQLGIVGGQLPNLIDVAASFDLRCTPGARC
ncbi:MAG: exo-alpha-sialidase, partial [Actinobacteria bacterium]|nr:exo-alpha-sialidase [Actinomycetota bacterium]